MEYKIKAEEYDHARRLSALRGMEETFPFLRRKNIGKSCAGRDLVAYKLGCADQYALIAAAFHGSERITSVVLMMFMERLCAALAEGKYLAGINVTAAMQNRGVIFVPCVNPDGCEIALKGAAACGNLAAKLCMLCRDDFDHWNANLRGVDINHNFNAGWDRLHALERSHGIFGPAPTRFGGPRPESEPETAALTQLCRTTAIRHCAALHTQGEVIYWSYGEKKPFRSKRMAQVLATSSGYTLDTPQGLAEGGGFKDWFIEAFDRPGFTIELGLGENPLPAKTAEEIYLRAEEMLTLCCIL